MLHMLGGVKIYTTEELDQIVSTKTDFVIVDSLPRISEALPNIIYYVRTQQTTESDEIDYWVNPEDSTDRSSKKDTTHTIPVYIRVPVIKPYVKGRSTESDEYVWYTSGGGSGVSSYNDLSHLPSINGEKLIGELDEDKARAPVSESGILGGYDLSISDNDIVDIVDEVFN